MTDKKAIETAKKLVQFCKEQDSCQNCVFRKHGASHWNCNIGILHSADFDEIESHYIAKRQNHGYI